MVRYVVSLFNLFFPKVCLGCNEFLYQQEQLVCVVCRHQLPVTQHHLSQENEVYNKFYGRLPLQFAASMFYYHKKGIGQRLIHQLKYKDKQALGELFAYWYAGLLESHDVFHTIDYIIPVPLHPKRLKERGYNQVHRFCEALSTCFTIPVAYDLLYRKTHLTSQSKKKLEERNAINENMFGCNENELYHNKHFLIIDDVLTTGATIESCGKALLKMPNVKISVLTMAFSQS